MKKLKHGLKGHGSKAGLPKLSISFMNLWSIFKRLFHSLYEVSFKELSLLRVI